MSPDDQLLYAFAWGLVVALCAAIAIPYLQRRSDLISTGNAFLVGGIIFIGFSSIGCATAVRHYAAYTSDTYYLFMAGVVWFFTVFLATYYGFRSPARWGTKLFSTWPEPTWAVTTLVVGILAALVASNYLVFIPGVSQVLAKMSEKAVPFVVVVAFTGWFRDRFNPMMASMALASLAGAMVMSVLLSGSRRTFLGVLIAAPICYYWYHARTRRPATNLLVAGGVLLGVAMAMASFSLTRWFDHGHRAKERTLATSIEQLSNTWSNLSEIDPQAQIAEFGQNAAEVSLYCIYRTDFQPARPFESVLLTLMNPVPRAMWPDKPEVLGLRLVREVLGHDRMNWGPGIVGHANNEGGIMGAFAMLAFYAVLIASCSRAADAALAAQPRNPFLVGILVASIPHILVTLRGDMTVAFVHLLASVMLLALMQACMLTLFGAAKNRQPAPAYWGAVPHNG